MLTVILNFIKPYLATVFIWLSIALAIVSATQTVRCSFKDVEISLLSTKLLAANEKLLSQGKELEKLKLLTDEQNARLADAYAQNIAIEKRHAKTIEDILKSRLPDSASCEDTAKWARDIARRRTK